VRHLIEASQNAARRAGLLTTGVLVGRRMPTLLKPANQA
jgi:hypothetical protein